MKIKLLSAVTVFSVGFLYAYQAHALCPTEFSANDIKTLKDSYSLTMPDSKTGKKMKLTVHSGSEDLPSTPVRAIAATKTMKVLTESMEDETLKCTYSYKGLTGTKNLVVDVDFSNSDVDLPND